jgi:hypothetical protein
MELLMFDHRFPHPAAVPQLGCMAGLCGEVVSPTQKAVIPRKFDFQLPWLRF